MRFFMVSSFLELWASGLVTHHHAEAKNVPMTLPPRWFS